MQTLAGLLKGRRFLMSYSRVGLRRRQSLTGLLKWGNIR